MSLKAYCDEKEMIRFEEGIFGFEKTKEYIALPIEEGTADTLCLQSVEDEDLSFLIVNPFSLDPTYDPKLSKEDLKALGTENMDELVFYVICIIAEKVENSTVNLKCPLVIHANKRIGIQAILQTPDYTFKHFIGHLKEKEV